jgi:hypothetical protein
LKALLLVVGGALALTSCAMKNTRSSNENGPAVPAQAPGTVTPPAFPARPEPQNDAEKKLDATLLRIAQAFQSGGSQQAEAVSKSLAVLGDDKRIKVDIALTDKLQATAFSGAMASLGAQVTVAFENHVFVLMPAPAIQTIASRADVFSMTAASATVGQ